MKYGKHTALVDEVINFVKSDRLLMPSEQQNANWLIITNLTEAQSCAWEKPIGIEGLIWTDLRELQMGEVRSVTYTQPEYADICNSLSVYLKQFTVLIRRRLDDQHQDLLDDIVGDLFNCAVNRAINGANGFFEQLYDAYRHGGWPCGWNGSFPSGELIVYFRQIA